MSGIVTKRKEAIGMQEPKFNPLNPFAAPVALFRNWRQALGSLSLAAILFLQSTPLALAQSTPMLDPGVAPIKAAVKGQITISREIKIAPENAKVSLSLRDAELRDVLNMLAQQGNFNIILDPYPPARLLIFP